MQDDFSHSAWRAIARALKDDILHLAAAQMLHALLAQPPGDRVGNIALAAAIRSDNARYSLTGEDEVSVVRKGLESSDFEASKLEHRQSVDLMRGVTPKLAPKTTYGRKL